MDITETIKFNKLQEENEALKEQLEMAHYFNQNLGKELAELKQQILYKEDFWFQSYCINCEKVDKCILSSCSENTWRNNYVLKDNYVLKHNPKYDKLPSKEGE
ncbi:hypothetical protein C6B38_04685 [Spiroplasma sp. ChiS]|uniref:hypothetical protein n=1 Tax=Spiroplasma sp. ChiS TaxID=2099885 RepID=UPI000CF84829|nr:hypothetical protein [Spiroplasma sp. ChiS]PQP78653.1 hypothetical protein C6B38_04685 [Spiroplasma sp. ChiS]